MTLERKVISNTKIHEKMLDVIKNVCHDVMTTKYKAIINFLDSTLFAVHWRLDFGCTITRSPLSSRNENKQNS